MSTNLELDLFTADTYQPLANKVRPQNIDEYIGQQHLLAQGRPLHKMLNQGNLHSIILWGPPGTGKTTLAKIIAQHINANFLQLSAVVSGIKDIREVVEQAKINRTAGTKTILFVDEVHRFNKSQQDAFLPYIEDGTLIFIGATTENPSFALNNALLSRCKTYILQALTHTDIEQIIQQALTKTKTNLYFTDNCLSLLAAYVQGDARLALNNLELLIDHAELKDQQLIVTKETLALVLGEKVARFDKDGDHYYELISALHKSIRGSAPDAALYWYARILVAGGDPLTVARRLLAIASEDIGNADPRAMQIALAAWDCFTRVGAYEGERAIAQAVIYLAVAAKSNATYKAFNQAKQHAKETLEYDVPLHLRNAPTNLMQELNYGKEYRYAHDEENSYAAGENYFPEALQDTQYYFPNNQGLEIQIQEKLKALKQIDATSKNKRYPKK